MVQLLVAAAAAVAFAASACAFVIPASSTQLSARVSMSATDTDTADLKARMQKLREKLMVNEPAKPYVSPKTGKPLGPISEYTEDWAVGIEKIKQDLLKDLDKTLEDFLATQNAESDAKWDKFIADFEEKGRAMGIKAAQKK